MLVRSLLVACVLGFAMSAGCGDPKPTAPTVSKTEPSAKGVNPGGGARKESPPQ